MSYRNKLNCIVNNITISKKKEVEYAFKNLAFNKGPNCVKITKNSGNIDHLSKKCKIIREQKLNSMLSLVKNV